MVIIGEMELDIEDFHFLILLGPSYALKDTAEV